jgi:hypothetical protein
LGVKVDMTDSRPAALWGGTPWPRACVVAVNRLRGRRVSYKFFDGHAPAGAGSR